MEDHRKPPFRGEVTRESDSLISKTITASLSIYDRLIALIDQPDIIEKTLTHLSLWRYGSHAQPDSAAA